jgi:hypothetical protein
MDARSILIGLLALISMSTSSVAQMMVSPRASVTSPNFRVIARNASLANQVAAEAERTRKELAIHWLGQEIPNWPQPCPLIVNDGNMLANGETKYTLIPEGGVANFQMTVSGSVERILDSVLPHEITHTILASHFSALGKPIPRWADEGACTTVEHVSERSKHDLMLVRYLSEGRGIPFAVLFSLRDYPPDIMPLYAQGYRLSCFLIAQGGPRQFVKFLERGMETEDWVAAVEEFYEYPLIGKLQTAWNAWVGDGGGAVLAYTATARGVSSSLTIAAAGTRSTIDSSVRTASATVPTSPSNPSEPEGIRAVGMMDTNNAYGASTSSYYVEQLKQNAGSRVATAPSSPALRSERLVPATVGQPPNTMRGIPYSASQPAPFQTLGQLPNSGTLRR